MSAVAGLQSPRLALLGTGTVGAAWVERYTRLQGAGIELPALAWLAKRNACRTSSCVNTLYQERVDAVCDMPVISGVHALCVSTQEVLQQQPKHPVQPQ